MDNGAKKPDLIQVIKTDQVSILALVIAVITWLLCLWTVLYPFLPEEFLRSSPLTGRDAPAYLKSALGTTLLAAALVVVRTASIFRIFNNGVEVTGSIKVLRIKGSRGYIIYTYNYEGKEYSRTATVNSAKRLKALLREGGPISLTVDRDKPGQVLIRDLYFQ